MLSAFDIDELEFFMCGEAHVDLEDWKRNTRYRGKLSENSDIIQWFWKIIEELD